jgi:hypothetical protein
MPTSVKLQYLRNCFPLSLSYDGRAEFRHCAPLSYKKLSGIKLLVDSTYMWGLAPLSVTQTNCINIAIKVEKIAIVTKSTANVVGPFPALV